MVCIEKTAWGCPAKTRKVLQNVGFCPAKKYFMFANMVVATSLSERGISLVIIVCYRWGQWWHICAVRRLGRSLAPRSR